MKISLVEGRLKGLAKRKSGVNDAGLATIGCVI